MSHCVFVVDNVIRIEDLRLQAAILSDVPVVQGAGMALREYELEHRLAGVHGAHGF